MRKAGGQLGTRACIAFTTLSAGLVTVAPGVYKLRVIPVNAAVLEAATLAVAALATLLDSLLLNGTKAQECIFFFFKSVLQKQEVGFFFSFFKGLHGTSQSGHKPPDELAAWHSQQICKVMQ